MDFGQLESAGGKIVTCVFKDDGRVLSVFAKRARGLFARHVVINRAKDIADLEAFSAEGYCLDRSQSSDSLLVFTRSKAQRLAPAKPTPGAKLPAKPKAKPKAKAERTSQDKLKPKVETTTSSTAARGKKRAASRAAAAEKSKKAVGGTGASRTKRAAPSGRSTGGARAKAKKK